MSRFIIIEYTNRGNIPPMFFPSGHTEKLILDAALAPTGEDVFEEGEEALHEFVPTFQRSTKKYTLETAPISDTTLEEIHRLPMYESVSVTLHDGEKVRMRNIEVEHSYPFPDAQLAMAEIRFDKGEVLTKKACCENMSKVEPVTVIGAWLNYVCHKDDGAQDGWKRATKLKVNYGNQEKTFEMVGIVPNVSSIADIEQMTNNQYISAYMILIWHVEDYYGITRLNQDIINDPTSIDETLCPITEPVNMFPVYVKVIRSSYLEYVANRKGLHGSVIWQKRIGTGYFDTEFGDLPFASSGADFTFMGVSGDTYRILNKIYYSPQFAPLLWNNVKKSYYISDEPKSLSWIAANLNLFTESDRTIDITSTKYIYLYVQPN